MAQWSKYCRLARVQFPAPAEVVFYLSFFFIEFLIVNLFFQANNLFKGAVAHGKRLSQKIQQLLNTKSLEYIFYTNM